MSNILYGIDFGTSNSALSIIDLDTHQILKTFSIPSVLYFPKIDANNNKGRVLTGNVAIEGYVSDGMQGRFMKSIKRVLPNTSFQNTLINGSRYDASDLVAFILKDLKKLADEFVAQDVVKAVLGRPVFFDDDDASKDALAQKRLQIAAEKVGFKEIYFQFEPIAAAFAYEKTIETKQRVLVGDLGGGTTDFTYIELNPEKKQNSDRRNDILATGGIYIGGDSFDSSFMWTKGTPEFGRGVKYESKPNTLIDLPLSLFLNITTWERMIFFNSVKVLQELKRYYFLSKNNPLLKNLMVLIEKNLGYSIFKEIEKVKIELSTKSETQFTFEKETIHISKEITKTEYKEIINNDINKIEKYLDKFLAKNNITQIDSIFLTGGTSLVPAVQKLFINRFGKENIYSGDNFISVANGLALSHYLVSN